MKHDSGELLDAILELGFLVLVEEEPRVGEARAHRSVVPFGDVGGGERGVGDGDVVGEELVLALARPRADPLSFWTQKYF